MAVYKVSTKVEGAPTRLVDARTKAQAIAHVVSDTIDAEVCDVSYAVALGAIGVVVEKAGEPGE